MKLSPSTTIARALVAALCLVVTVALSACGHLGYRWLERTPAAPAVSQAPPSSGAADPRGPEPSSRPLRSLAFDQAKRVLANRVYATADSRVELYCGCSYADDGRIDAESCGFKPDGKGSARSRRIEWEHLVPASRFGKPRACWTQGHPACAGRDGKPFKGRECCREVDPEFRAQEGDLFNLVPAVGELNAARSDFPAWEVRGEERRWGACDFEIDKVRRRVELPQAALGDFARAHLYMAETWGMPLVPGELETLKRWDAIDPPGPEEINRARLIEGVQGNRNRWTTGR